MAIDGTSADDVLLGTTGEDIFRLWIGGGGKDSAYGGEEHDLFRMRGTFDALDQIDGGAGPDRVNLNGDYSAQVAFTATTMVNVERLRCAGGFDYNLKTADETVASGARLVVNAGTASSLTFDGSAENDGRFKFLASAGNDVITGGDQDDVFGMGRGGDDIVHAGDGDDSILFAGTFTAGEQVDGGEGIDHVHLNGDYSGANAVVFAATTMVAVEWIDCAAGHSYDLTTADETVDSFTNLTLGVNALALGAGESLIFDGSAEEDSNFTVLGGDGDDDVTGGLYADTIRGRGGNDTINGGGGVDFIWGGTGFDTFVYTAPAESTGIFHDRINDFEADGGGVTRVGTASAGDPGDFIDVPVTVGFVHESTHAVSFATFEADIQNDVGDSLDAEIITVTSGDYAGRIFLVIDGDDDFKYASGSDYVIDITHYTGTITTDNFI